MLSDKNAKYTSKLFVTLTLILIAIFGIRAIMVNAEDTLGPVCTATGDYQVCTDLADYSPESTVHVQGTGFLAENNPYLIQVIRPDGSIVTGDGSFVLWPTDYDYVTSTDGIFYYDYVLDGILGEYTIGVLDSNNNVIATHMFTDATGTTTTLNAISTPLTSGQTSVSFSGQVANSKGGENVQLRYASSCIQGNGGTSVATTTVSSGNFGGTFTAPSAGTYYFWAYYVGTPGRDPSSSACQTITVNAAAVCGNGIVQSGEQCDDGNTNNGDCCSSTCQFESASIVCRASAGVCDLAETCTGTSATCPADAKLTSVCRAADGACDVTESCNGVDNACPSDAVRGIGYVCAAESGQCDAEDTCDGVTKVCNENYAAPGIACNDGLFCKINEACDGSGNCNGGTARDCSGSNNNPVGICTNIPDSNLLTWDYYAGFTSTCNEGEDSCTTEVVSVISTCDYTQCSAQCDATHACADSTCSKTYNDYCTDLKLTEYDADEVMDSTIVSDSEANTCLGTCLCTENSVDCSAPATNTYCVKDVCGATCDSNDDCAATECDTNDDCYDHIYRDYSDVNNNCLDSCSCKQNACTVYTSEADNDGDGYSASCGDCNDANKDINPAAIEIAGDGVDQNCDGRETLIVTANSQTKVYGAANPTLTFQYSRFLGTDTSAVLDTAPTASTAATQYSDVGSYPITIAGGIDNNYDFTYIPSTLTIGKATPIIVVTLYSVIYDGDAHTATATAKGVEGEDLTGMDLTGTSHTAAGTYNDDPWTFTDVTGNYNNAAGTVDDSIGKADATIIVTPYDVTYDGDPHTATGTAKGVLDESLSGLVLTGTTHTNVGDYTDSWTFTDVTGNYNNAGSTVNDKITKATSTTTITCPVSEVYTGAAITPCTVSVTGAGGLSLTPTPDYTANTNVGTATASYTFTGDANHAGSSDTKNFAITKASSTTVVTCTGDKVYTGSEIKTCSVAVTGVGGLSLTPDPVYANNVNVGTASASYTYAGDDNHEGSTDSETFGITKASSTTVVTCTGDQVYTGAAIETCSATVTGAGTLNEAVTVTYTDNTIVGTATASATYAGDANHEGSSDSETFAITKASSTTVVTCTVSEVYTGAAITPCTVSVTGVGGLSLTPLPVYANNIIVGTATASYNYAGDANHAGSSGSDTFVITKASSSVTVTCPAIGQTYTGSAIEPCTASYSGAGGLTGSLTPTYTNNVIVGTATASASYAGDDNHEGSSNSATFDITKASSTTVVTCTGDKVYTGSPIETCSATVTGAGTLNQPVTVTYTDNVVVGTASASATFAGDANHETSTDSKTFSITKATSTTVVSCPVSQVYTGSAIEPCTASYSGAGGLTGSLTPTYADNTNVGTATASATYAGDANHEGSSDSETFGITKATSTTLITCTVSETYTGAEIKPCSVSVTGVGGLSLTPLPVYADNIAVGTASASYNYAGDANHESSSDSETFAITKASSTTVVSCPASQTYTGVTIEPCTATVSGVGGLSESVTVTYADNTIVGTATASATFAGDANHAGSSDSEIFGITKATSTTVVSCPVSEVYTGSAITPCTVSVTGVGGLSLTPTPDYADNTNVGTASASYNYAGDANHDGSSDTETFSITKASSTTVVTCTGDKVYTGTAIETCSVTVTGAALSLTPDPIYTNNVNVGTATASYNYAGDANHDGSSDTETFSITKATSTTIVTCTASETYTGSAITPCTVSVTGAGSLSLTPNPVYADNIVVGTATASYNYAGDLNHDGSLDSETFAITQKALTITANSNTKEGGITLTFAGIEFTSDGLVNSDTVTSVTLASDGAVNTAPVGVYDIVASDALGTGLGNYNIGYTKGTLTVVDTTPPPAPSPVSPADGSFFTTATLPAIDWTDVNDVNGVSKPVSYIYESSRSSSTNSDGSFVSKAYVSGPLSASQIPTGGTPEGTYYWHVKAVDARGNPSDWSITQSVIVDNTPPIITGSRTPAANANGWNNAAVTAQFVCTDALSGIASCTPDTTLSGEGANQHVLGTAVDRAGNSATFDVTGISIDLTAPIITVTGTNPLTIEVHSSYTDAGATVTDNLDPGVTVISSGSVNTHLVGAYTIYYDAVDAAGNAAEQKSRIINVVDTTPPVIAAHADVTAEATSSAGAVVSYTNPTATDNYDASITVSCAPLSGTQFALGDTTVKCNAKDAAGNNALETSFVVHVVDTTAPVIAAHANVVAEATSAAGAIVTYASPATSDAVDGAGVATCAPASGSTFAPGETTVTCTATDAHGNAAVPTTFKVNVNYKWTGFFQPIDNPGLLGLFNKVNAGRAIPVKFSLGGDMGLNIFATDSPSTVKIDCNLLSLFPDTIEETVTAGGSSLNYDSAAKQYIYVWKTEKSWAGTCRQLQVKLSDGKMYTANFKFTK